MDELWSSFHSRHRLQPLPASSLFLLPLTAERDLRSLTNSTHECEQHKKKKNKKEVEKKKDVKNRIKNKQNNKQTAEVTAKHLKINRSVRAHLIKYVCLLWACHIGMWGSCISLSLSASTSSTLSLSHACLALILGNWQISSLPRRAKGVAGWWSSGSRGLWVYT